MVCRVSIGKLNFNGNWEVFTTTVLDVLSFDVVVLAFWQSNPVTNVLIVLRWGQSLSTILKEVFTPVSSAISVSDHGGVWSLWVGFIKWICWVKVQSAWIIRGHVEPILGGGGCFEPTWKFLFVLGVLIHAIGFEWSHKVCFKKWINSTSESSKPCADAVSCLVLVSLQAWLSRSWVGFWVCCGWSGQTGYAISLVSENFTWDIINQNTNISSIKTPSWNGEILTTGDKAAWSTNGLNLRVSSDCPTIISSEIAGLWSWHVERITRVKEQTRLTILGWRLVSAFSIDRTYNEARESLILSDSAL